MKLVANTMPSANDATATMPRSRIPQRCGGWICMELGVLLNTAREWFYSDETGKIGFTVIRVKLM